MAEEPAAQEVSDSTRQILDAAAEVFAEEGFAGARVDEIARRAGVNKAMLYYHVGGKGALYEAVLLRAFSGAWEEIGRRAAPAASPAERLGGLIRALGAQVARSPNYPKLMLRELATGGAHLPAPVMSSMSKIAGLVRSILEEGRREGAMRRCDPLMVHLTILGGLMALNVSSPIRKKLLAKGIEVVPGNAFTEEIPDFLIGLVLSGLQSKDRRAGRAPRKVRRETPS